MAKKSRKGSVNKSQAIRDFAAANEDAGPTAIAAALKEQGIIVSKQFVSTILSKAQVGKRKRRGRPAGSANGSASTGRVSADSLMAAKRFVSQMGGVQKAKEAMDLLARLLD